MSAPRHATRPVVLLGLAAAGGVVLTRCGSGALAPPPLRSADALQTWAGSRSAIEMAMALTRVAAMAGCGYIAAVAALVLATRILGWRPAVRAADALTTPGLRRLMAFAGAGVTVATLTGPVAAAGAAPLSAPPVLVRLGPTGASGPATDARRSTADDSDVATMHRLADGTGDLTGAGTAGTPVPAPVAAPETWTIEPGENLWLVAHDTLADAWGRAPTDVDINAYWSALITANHDRLPDPSNPDLVFSGTVVVLPPVPKPP